MPATLLALLIPGSFVWSEAHACVTVATPPRCWAVGTRRLWKHAVARA